MWPADDRSDLFRPGRIGGVLRHRVVGHEKMSRPTFASRYTTAKDKRHPKGTEPRLLDCLLDVAPHGSERHIREPENGTFAVYDSATREKAFFEMPWGASPVSIAAMIERTFAETPTRISAKTWIV